MSMFAAAYLRVMATAHQNPDLVAIDTGLDQITYGRFAESILAAAGGLARLCLPRQSRIGLVADKVPATYAWYLACWHHAHTVVPLNPGHPSAFTMGLVRDARLEAVVLDVSAHPSLAVALRDGGITVLDVREPDPRTEARTDPLRPDDFAYILFTSGSTGRPKGVPITHGGLAAFLNIALPHGDLGPGARLSHTFALTFDPSVYDMLAAWTTGATLVLPRGQEHLAPVSYVRSREITHWYSVPSLAAHARRSGGLRDGSMPTLRQSLFVGEALTLSMAAEWARAAPHTVIRNVYGPTELTITCTDYQLPKHRRDWPVTDNGTVPIGSVHRGVDWVMVEAGRVSDTSGELCVRGVQRFGGYLSPADNAGRFVAIAGDVATPVAGDPTEVRSDHWYRTGDRVRFAEGVLHHLGRVDRQVKVSGHRIELGEVEWKLSSHPNVLESVVVAVSNAAGRLELRAAVTGTPVAFPDLRRFLLAIMPTYMVPAKIEWMTSFPVNANGKVNYLKLAELLAD